MIKFQGKRAQGQGEDTNTGRRPWRFIALGMAAFLSIAGPAPAETSAPAKAASEARIAFDIPAQPLQSAVTAFGLQAGYQIAVDQATLSGREGNAVRGRYTPAAALGRLLADTGVTYELIDNNSVTLLAEAPAAAEAAPEPLPPLSGEGESAAGRFPYSDLPEAYEGGQVAEGGRLGLLGNQDLFYVPFNVTSYTSELIENQQARSVRDIVRNDPSARQTYGEQAPFERMAIRGFSSYLGAERYDGLPGLTGSRSTIETVERVEIFKGPNALLNNGPGGVGGIINLTPKRPLDTPLTRLTASYDYQSRLGAHIDLSRRFGSEAQFGVRLNAVYRAGESATEGNKARLSEAALALEYRGERLKLETVLDYHRRDLRGGDTFIFLDKNARAVPGVPDLGKAIQQPWEKTELKHTRALLRAAYKLSPDWTAHAAFGAKQGGYSIYRTVFNRLKANGDAKLGFQNFGAKRPGHSWQGGIRGQFQTGVVSHQLTLEVAEAKSTHSAPGNATFIRSGLIDSNLYRPVSVAPWIVADLRNFRKVFEGHNASIAIADTLGFMDDRILLTAGLRRQSIGSKNFNRAGAITRKYDQSAITPATGLMVKAWDRVSLYGNYIQALEQGRAAPRGTLNEGEHLPPYVSEQVEFGVKLDLDGLGLTAAAFQIEKSSALTNADRRYVADGEQRNRGLELNVFGELRPGLRLLGGVTYINAELTRTEGGKYDGKTALDAPRRQAAINLEWDVPILPGLTLAARAEHVDSGFIRRDNSLKVPAYQLYGLGARYQHTIGDRQFILRMNIDNLLDKDYWSNSYSDDQLHTGGPRSFAMSFTVDF